MFDLFVEVFSPALSRCCPWCHFYGQQGRFHGKLSKFPYVDAQSQQIAGEQSCGFSSGVTQTMITAGRWPTELCTVKGKS